MDANIVIATLRTLRIIYQYDDVPSDVLFQVSTTLLTMYCVCLRVGEHLYSMYWHVPLVIQSTY